MVYGEDSGTVRMWSLDCQHNTLGILPGTTAAPPSAIFARGSVKAPDTAVAHEAGLQGVHTDSPCELIVVILRRFQSFVTALQSCMNYAQLEAYSETIMVLDCLSVFPEIQADLAMLEYSPQSRKYMLD
jgi:hypothetical protein